MAKWKGVNELVSYLRVNASVGAMAIWDVYAAGLSMYNLSEGEIYIVLDALTNLKLIEDSYREGPEGVRQFLWIGGE